MPEWLTSGAKRRADVWNVILGEAKPDRIVRM